jgi:hypothetical protein
MLRNIILSTAKENNGIHVIFLEIAIGDGVPLLSPFSYFLFPRAPQLQMGKTH